MHLSIFWRIVLTSLVIIVMMAGVNLYALFQLRQLTSLSANMATHHYPAIESAKRLLTVLFAQLNSEKKYLAVRDATFLQHFDEEVDEFHRGLQSLEAQELTPQGIQLLEDTKHLQQERLTILHTEFQNGLSSPAAPSSDYEDRRDALMDRISAKLQQFIDLHETGISVGVSRSRESSAQAEAVTEQLVLLALVFGIALAGFASYTVLRPLRQLQSHIKQIGQGNFRASLNIRAPSE
ncbi:MAG: CHASE3 domain-containing protein, partial [Nitrospirota bacterium]